MVSSDHQQPVADNPTQISGSVRELYHRPSTILHRTGEPMKQIINLTVNGEVHELAVSPARMLIEVLRDDLELTGTKNGCGQGDCGCCTVLLDGAPVNACLVPAVAARGLEVLTIEGLAEGGALHPLQKSF